jgi:hypothetical protein
MRPIHLQAGLVQEAIRAHIDSCGSKIGAVLFIKKDGTLRHMRFNGKAMRDTIKGTDRGIAASAARAISNPNLRSIPEITPTGAQWRTVNLDTVLTVRSGGKVTRYREIERLAPGLFALVPLVTMTLTIGRVE